MLVQDPERILAGNDAAPAEHVFNGHENSS
jgi:hypothetical protein